MNSNNRRLQKFHCKLIGFGLGIFLSKTKLSDKFEYLVHRAQNKVANFSTTKKKKVS